jgi:xanthine dehydrogenase accessory factor
VEVYDALARARGRGRTVVLVTVLAVEGDAPSHPGAKLVVGGEADGEDAVEVLAGTLGCSEFDTAGLTLATEALAADGPLRRTVDFPGHGRERAIELFAEVHHPEAAMLVLGANPVGRAVADVAVLLGRRTVLVAPGGDTGVRSGVEVKADDPGRYLLAAPPGPRDAIVVSDHDAPWVDEVLRIALASEAPYVAMLGSRRHAPEAVRRLRDAGVPERSIARLRSPAGLDIGSRTPEEIALSIVAEVVAVERGRDGGSMTIDWSATS